MKNLLSYLLLNLLLITPPAVSQVGDVPPEIEIYHVGVSTTEGVPDPIPPGTEIRVYALANDENPSGGAAGVETLLLHWQLNSLTSDETSSIMTKAYNMVVGEYVYAARILGQTNV